MSSGKFPKAEAEVLELGQKMLVGFAAHTDLYPAPPVSLADFDAVMADWSRRRDKGIPIPSDIPT